MKSKVINPYRKWTASPIPNWLLKRTEVSSGAKLCYGRLVQYAGKNGKAFPKQKVMAEELGLSTARTVRKYLKELKSHGLIQVKQSGKKRSNTYFFLDHEWMSEERNDCAENGGANVPPTQEQTFPSHRNNGSGPYEENQLNESIKSSAQEIIYFISSELEEVQKLDKQLTSEQAYKLIETYGKEIVKLKLEAMENYKRLTLSYTSVYRTLNSWCERNMNNDEATNSTIRLGAIDL